MKAVWKAWNWKSALLSVLFRAPIFVITGFRHGWAAVAGAVLAEGVFRAVTSGFYGALAQRLIHVRPFWKAAVVLSVVLPVVEQTLDYFLHRMRDTPNLGWSMLLSSVLMAISALFNWYAMQRGALRTGVGAQSFASDLMRLPALLFRFLTVAPRAFWRSLFTPVSDIPKRDADIPKRDPGTLD